MAKILEIAAVDQQGRRVNDIAIVVVFETDGGVTKWQPWQLPEFEPDALVIGVECVLRGHGLSITDGAEVLAGRRVHINNVVKFRDHGRNQGTER